MSNQEQFQAVPSRNTEAILKTYNSDVKQMRAKAAKARIAARKKVERDEQMKAAIEKIPLEHRYVPDHT